MANLQILELTNIIAKNEAKINEYLERLETPANLVTDPAIAGCRKAVLEATDELHDSMLGPMDLLISVSVCLSINTVFMHCCGNQC